jgi:hypothetical protein
MRALAVILVVVVGGCATAPATPTPALPTETAIGPLEPGRYTYSGFSPRIEVEVSGEGWETFHREPEFWDVARHTEDGVVALMFLHPPTIIGPDGPVPATTADAALATLRANDELTIADERTVEIGGREARQLTITVQHDDTHMLGSVGALLGIGPEDAVRLAFFDADDGVLVIGIVAQRAALEAADALLAPVIATVRISS